MAVALTQMTTAKPSVAEARSAQLYPIFDATEVARLMRFGTERTFEAGTSISEGGTASAGILIILSGNVEVISEGLSGTPATIVRHGAGSVQGELAQLSGRPSLVSARAINTVTAIVLSTIQLHDLLMSEAVLGERIMRALILRRMLLLEQGLGGPVILGRAGDPDVLRMCGFLARNAHPYLQLDPDSDPAGDALLQRLGPSQRTLPLALCPGGTVLQNPGEEALARCVGLLTSIDADRPFDLIVVGAGPAGLACSVYAASEGLDVLLVDCNTLGGQAGASARIENFLGFPTGISGASLMARAYIQAQKFGVRTMIPAEVVRLTTATPSEHILTLANGETLRSRAVVVATGAHYRRLAVAGFERFEGSSIHYWASPLEARLCLGQSVALVGGGNSAGQAAVFLADVAETVTLISRRDISDTMSAYLVARILSLPNVVVITGAEISGLVGQNEALEAVICRDRSNGEIRTVEARHLFLFIGADPNTFWLRESGMMLDRHGYILTEKENLAESFILETSQPGVFAIGDVRSGSTKRVASAAGDGAQVIAALHRLFAT